VLSADDEERFSCLDAPEESEEIALKLLHADGTHTIILVREDSRTSRCGVNNHSARRSEVMAEVVSSRRSDRLVISMFALIGAVAGFFWLFAYSDPLHEPVSTVVASYTQSGPHPEATLSVMFFGRFGYTRSAPDPAAFNAEVMFWQLAPLIVAILGGALCGGLIAYLLSRWLHRVRY
jgi:hypothetical protein